MADPDGQLERGVLPLAWAGGEAAKDDEPAVRVHAYNRDLVILRQSGRTHFEKPFLYLIFGADRALLVDTGAPGADVADAVHRAIAERAAKTHSAIPHLLVAHTHGHSDHVAGDAQFRDDPRATLIPARLDAAGPAFGIAAGTWPGSVGFVDLGGDRVLDVIPVPGHEAASVAFLRSPHGAAAVGRRSLSGPPLRSRWTRVPRQHRAAGRLHSHAPGGPHPRRAHRERTHAVSRLP